MILKFHGCEHIFTVPEIFIKTRLKTLLILLISGQV